MSSPPIRPTRPPEQPPWPWDLARQRCLREARRILRDRDDAEEAVQEAMARAWRGRAACRTPGSPLPWLLKITRNEALRLAARRRRRELAEIHDVPEEPARYEPPSDTAIEQALTALATKQALRALCPDDLRLIRLRYVDDLTQGQVAEALGVPEGTVKVRLHRARARLRGTAAELAA